MTDADTETETDIDDNEPNLSELAERVIDELDPGQTIGDKIVLSRRQLVAIAGGGLSLGALGTFGVSDAQAQSAVGTIGTSSSPVDVEAASVNAGSVNTNDGTIGGKPILGGPESGSDAGLSFRNSTQSISTQPVLLALNLSVETDGTTRGFIQVEVDETNDGNIDQRYNRIISPAHGAGANMRHSLTIYIPSNGQLFVENRDDPTGNNTIHGNRIYEVSE